MCLYLATTNGKIFSFFNILNFARGTRISNCLILDILIGWAVEYCGDVMFYYFLLAIILVAMLLLFTKDYN